MRPVCRTPRGNASRGFVAFIIAIAGRRLPDAIRRSVTSSRVLDQVTPSPHRHSNRHDVGLFVQDSVV